MTCKEWNGDFLKALGEFAYRDAILCPYQMNIGGPEFATLILGAIGMSFMIKQDSPAIAAVVGIIFGGVFMTQIVGIASTIMTVLILTMVGIGPVLLLRRMSR